MKTNLISIISASIKTTNKYDKISGSVGYVAVQSDGNKVTFCRIKPDPKGKRELISGSTNVNIDGTCRVNLLLGTPPELIWTELKKKVTCPPILSPDELEDQYLVIDKKPYIDKIGDEKIGHNVVGLTELAKSEKLSGRYTNTGYYQLGCGNDGLCVVYSRPTWIKNPIETVILIDFPVDDNISFNQFRPYNKTELSDLFDSLNIFKQSGGIEC